jgi:hypothetical protein
MEATRRNMGDSLIIFENGRQPILCQMRHAPNCLITGRQPQQNNSTQNNKK